MAFASRGKIDFFFDMSCLADFGVLTEVRDNVLKFFGVGAWAGIFFKPENGAESELKKWDSAHLW